MTMRLGHQFASWLLVLLQLLAGAVVAQGDAGEGAFVHVGGGEEIASSTVSSEGLKTSGSVTGKGTQAKATIEFDADGWVVRYERSLRRGAKASLVQGIKMEQMAGGRGYRIRETNTFGSRTRTLRSGRVQIVFDPVWPEGMIQPLLMRGQGKVRVLLLNGHRVVDAEANFSSPTRPTLRLPGAVVRFEVSANGEFQRLILPGGDLAIQAKSLAKPERAKASAVSELPETLSEREVSIAKAPLIGGTLTRPKTMDAAEHDAMGVLLIADLRSRDRNGNGAGWESYLLQGLAYDLASEGAVVLRYDAQDPMGGDVGFAALLKDAQASLAALKSQQEVNPKRIVLCGHGQGALLAAALASSNPDSVVAVIALAPPAQPLAGALEAEVRARMTAEGAASGALEQSVREVREDLQALRSEDPAAVFAPGRRLLKDLQTKSPITSFLAVPCPLLILFGEMDPTVPARHRSMLKTSLQARAKQPWQLELVMGVGGEFRVATTPAQTLQAVLLAERPKSPALRLRVREFLTKKLR